jgi:hypothetical protein
MVSTVSCPRCIENTTVTASDCERKPFKMLDDRQTLLSEVPSCLERPVQASNNLAGQSIHVHGHVSPHEGETIDGLLAQVSNKIDGRLEELESFY